MSNNPASQGSSFPDRRARVLIADDSVVARGLFNRWISEHPAMFVVAIAVDGLSAVKAAAKHQPDLVVLDIDMPVMDGLTALPEILKASPASNILIASSLTARSARLSMQCLALGAVDIQPKPESNRDLTMSLGFRQELLHKLEGLIGANPRAGHSARTELATVAGKNPDLAALVAPVRPYRPDVVPRALVIGASTGGPRAVSQVLADLGDVCDKVPVFVVQHMPPLFTTSFAEQLQQKLGRTVKEAVDGDVPIAGTVFVAPGGRHLRLEKADGQIRMRLDDSAPVKFCRPSIDMFFTDAATAYGASALAVILTGMGTDGLDGTRLLRSSGSMIIAQDEATSVVWGMPGAVSREGLADHVLPVFEIGALIRSSFPVGDP